jgi:hypothetical protein
MLGQAPVQNQQSGTGPGPGTGPGTGPGNIFGFLTVLAEEQAILDEIKVERSAIEVDLKNIVCDGTTIIPSEPQAMTLDPGVTDKDLKRQPYGSTLVYKCNANEKQVTYTCMGDGQFMSENASFTCSP